MVKEKVIEIQPFKQAREVLEVRLRPNAKDLNSIIEAVANVDGTQMKIWVPAMFISILKPESDSFIKSLNR